MLLNRIFGLKITKSKTSKKSKISKKNGKKSSKNVSKIITKKGVKKPVVCGTIKSRTKCLKYKRKCAYSMKTKRCKRR